MLIVIPGPSVVFTVGRALAYGRGVALATVLGNSLGLLVVLVLVAFGLSVVVRESVVVFLVLKLLGAAYLVHLGVQAIRHRRAFDVTVRHSTPLPLPTALRERHVGRLTIKKRGVDVVPEQLRKRLLQGAPAGGEEATLVLTRVAGRGTALLVRPLR